jgi:protease I
MELKGKRIAVLAEEQFEDLELFYPLLRFREAGAHVSVVGPKAVTYGSKHGYPVKADLASKEADPDRFDAVVIPGGYAPDRMRRDGALVSFVRNAFLKGKVVAAICHGGWMLASAEILEGKEVTGFSSIRDDLVHAGARYVDREVVRDGNLVTSRKPEDLPAFCRTVAEALAEVRSRRRAA